MTDKRLPFDREEFDSEHAKRDRHITEQQRRWWADGLISRLPDSIAYRNACTPHARLKEQELLNVLVAEWKRSQQENGNAAC
ncbi:MAG TPA: hypothetical protein VM260_28055 [Pirellula sp.]|nr:hypothetical protein [Pirellula sp.]